MSASSPSTLTTARRAMIVTATAVGFVVGFYLGFFVLLSTVGLDEVAAWQFELTTIPAAGLGAGLAASLATPPALRSWALVLGSALAAAAVVAVGVALVDGDFGTVMVVGGPVVVGATVLAAFSGRRSGPNG